MTESPDSNLYTRGAILQWASEILQRQYATLNDVAASDIAVLLHAIFNHTEQSMNTTHANSTTISLHDIQFVEHPTSTIRFLNAKRVLALVQTLSSSTYHNNTINSNNDGGVSRHRLVSSSLTSSSSSVGNMTVSAWIEGKAFVEELKMWRWIRAEAQSRGLEIHALKSAAQTFLHGTVVKGNNCAILSQTTDDAIATRKRARLEETTPVDPADMCLKNKEDDIHPETKMSQTAEFIITIPPPPPPPARLELPGSEGTASVKPLQNITCDGVDAAPQLLKVLETVKKELEEQKAAMGKYAIGVGTGATLPNTEANMSENTHSTTVRQPVTCSTCPGIFAAAVQQNFAAIEKLEAVRRMAVAACLKRDVVELLKVLAFV